MSKNNKKVLPKLRFSEFNNNPKWDVRKLGHVSAPVKEKAGTKKYTLMSVTSGEGLISQIEKFGREIAGNSYKNYYIIKKNDFAYNKSATKLFPEGYISMLIDYDEAALPNSIFTCFRIIDEECEPRFFDHLFHNNYHGAWLRKYIEVGARAHGALSVNTKHLWDMPIALPKLDEQQKIADCLSSLDDLIYNEDKKLIALISYKKGLLQKLFPDEGETVPELRFSEFRDCDFWIQKKLGTFADVLMCKRIFASETNEKAGVPFYKIGTIGSKADAFIERELFDEYKSKYNYPKKGEILITCSGTVGKCLAYDGNDAYYQDSNIVWIDNPTQVVSNQFLMNLLENVDWKRLNTTTITRIYGSDLRNLTLVFPEDPKEQNKISDLISSIDEIIKEQRKKIETLKVHKKGLMQGLFPSIEEVIQ